MHAPLPRPPHLETSVQAQPPADTAAQPPPSSSSRSSSTPSFHGDDGHADPLDPATPNDRHADPNNETLSTATATTPVASSSIRTVTASAAAETPPPRKPFALRTTTATAVAGAMGGPLPPPSVSRPQAASASRGRATAKMYTDLEVNELISKVSRLEKEARALNHSLETVAGDNLRLSDVVVNLQRQITSLTQVGPLGDSLVAVLFDAPKAKGLFGGGKEKPDEKQRREQMRDFCDQLQKEYVAYRTSHASSNDEVQELLVSLQSAHRTIQEHAQAFTAATKEQRPISLNAVDVELESECSKLREELDEERDLTVTLRSALEASESNVAQLNEAMMALHQEADQRRLELSERESELAAAQTLLSAARSQSLEAQQAARVLQEKVARDLGDAMTEAKSDFYSSMNAWRLTTIDAVAEIRRASESESAFAKAQLGGLSATQKELKQQREAAEHQIKALSEKHAKELRELNAQHSTEVSEFRDKLRASTDGLKRLGESWNRDTAAWNETLLATLEARFNAVEGEHKSALALTTAKYDDHLKLLSGQIAAKDQQLAAAQHAAVASVAESETTYNARSAEAVNAAVAAKSVAEAALAASKQQAAKDQQAAAAQHDATKAELQRVSADAAAVRVSLKAAQDDLEALKAKHAKLSKDHDQLQADCVRLQIDLVKAKETVANIESDQFNDKTFSAAKYAALEVELRKAQDEVSLLHDRTQHGRDVHGAVPRAVSDNAGPSTSAASTHDDPANRIAELEAHVAALVSQLTAVCQERDQMVETLTAQLEQAEAKSFAFHQAAAAAASPESPLQKKELEGLRSTLSETEARVIDLEVEKEGLEHELASERGAAAEHAHAWAALESQLRADLKAANDEIGTLKEKLAAVAAVNTATEGNTAMSAVKVAPPAVAGVPSARDSPPPPAAIGVQSDTNAVPVAVWAIQKDTYESEIRSLKSRLGGYIDGLPPTTRAAAQLEVELGVAKAELLTLKKALEKASKKASDAEARLAVSSKHLDDEIAKEKRETEQAKKLIQALEKRVRIAEASAKDVTAVRAELEAAKADLAAAQSANGATAAAAPTLQRENQRLTTLAEELGAKVRTAEAECAALKLQLHEAQAVLLQQQQHNSDENTVSRANRSAVTSVVPSPLTAMSPVGATSPEDPNLGVRGGLVMAAPLSAPSQTADEFSAPKSRCLELTAAMDRLTAEHTSVTEELRELTAQHGNSFAGGPDIPGADATQPPAHASPADPLETGSNASGAAAAATATAPLATKPKKKVVRAKKAATGGPKKSALDDEDDEAADRERGPSAVAAAAKSLLTPSAAADAGVAKKSSSAPSTAGASAVRKLETLVESARSVAEDSLLDMTNTLRECEVFFEPRRTTSEEAWVTARKALSVVLTSFKEAFDHAKQLSSAADDGGAAAEAQTRIQSLSRELEAARTGLSRAQMELSDTRAAAEKSAARFNERIRQLQEEAKLTASNATPSSASRNVSAKGDSKEAAHKFESDTAVAAAPPPQPLPPQQPQPSSTVTNGNSAKAASAAGAEQRLLEETAAHAETMKKLKVAERELRDATTRCRELENQLQDRITELNEAQHNLDVLRKSSSNKRTILGEQDDGSGVGLPASAFSPREGIHDDQDVSIDPHDSIAQLSAKLKILLKANQNLREELRQRDEENLEGFRLAQLQASEGMKRVAKLDKQIAELKKEVQNREAEMQRTLDDLLPKKIQLIEYMAFVDRLGVTYPFPDESQMSEVVMRLDKVAPQRATAAAPVAAGGRRAPGSEAVVRVATGVTTTPPVAAAAGGAGGGEPPQGTTKKTTGTSAGSAAAPTAARKSSPAPASTSSAMTGGVPPAVSSRQQVPPTPPPRTSTTAAAFKPPPEPSDDEEDVL